MSTQYPMTLDLSKLVKKYNVAVKKDSGNYSRRKAGLTLPSEFFLRGNDVIKGFFIDPKKGLKLDKDPVNNSVPGGEQWLYCSVVDVD